MESMTKNMPKHTAKNIQIPPAVPPLFKEIPMILLMKKKHVSYALLGAVAHEDHHTLKHIPKCYPE
jgi:hypothetical protein